MDWLDLDVDPPVGDETPEGREARGRSRLRAVGRWKLARLQEGKPVTLQAAYRPMPGKERFSDGRIVVKQDVVLWRPSRGAGPDRTLRKGEGTLGRRRRMPSCEPWEPWERWETYDIAEIRSPHGDFALAMHPEFLLAVLRRLGVR